MQFTGVTLAHLHYSQIRNKKDGQTSENSLFYFVYGDYRKKIFIILSGKGYRCLYEHFNDKQR